VTLDRAVKTTKFILSLSLKVLWLGRTDILGYCPIGIKFYPALELLSPESGYTLNLT
jgi:hypothetical protein